MLDNYQISRKIFAMFAKGARESYVVQIANYKTRVVG